MREFLYVDDMAEASVHVMGLSAEVYANITSPMLSHINVGTGVDCTIRTMAETIASVVGYTGKISFDSTKPDGTQRKLMDVNRLKDLGWEYRYTLDEGLKLTYAWYLQHLDSFRSHS